MPALLTPPQLSLYVGPGPNSKMHPQPPSCFCRFFRALFVTPKITGTSVVAFRLAEKRRLRKFFFRQRSPRCSRMPLQTVDFAKFDLPEMDFCPARDDIASHASVLRLGDLQKCKKNGLWQRFLASRGAISKPKLHDCHWKVVELQTKFQNEKCTIDRPKTREGL